MRKLIVSEFVSLDGVMEGPGANDSFRLAGWTNPYANDEFMKFKSDELFSSDALLLGRVTYDGFAAAWPKITDAGEFGDKMNSMQKYAVSEDLENPSWNNTEVIKDDVVDEIKKLKEKDGQDILIFGSAILIETLMENNLVDEYRLLVYPVILGEGKKLFKDGIQAKLDLIEARPFKTGIVLLTYRPAAK